MRKNFNLFPLAALTALLALPLAAAEPQGWHLGGDISSANDSLYKATERRFGLGLTVGLDRKLGDTNVGLRPGFSIHFLPGNKRNDDTKVGLTALQLAADLLIPSGFPNANLVVGLSVNQWRYAVTGNPYGLSGSKAPGDLKLGFKAGLDVKVHEKITVEAVLQMVEFGRAYSSTNFNGDCFNPTWIQVGARYHF